MNFASKVVALHKSLESAGIPYAIGGALALAYCVADPRATADVDVNVFVGTDRAEAVFDALPKGVSIGPDAFDIVRERGQIRLYWEETPVDLFFGVHRFHEAAAIRTRMVPFKDQTMPVLDCTDLVVFKTLYGRTQDWADIEAMADAGSSDFIEALNWVADFLGSESAPYRHLAAISEGRRGDDAFAYRDPFRRR